MSETYDRYLRTSHWIQTRMRMLELFGDSCEFCGTEDSLNVHHLNYDRLGHEEPEDLAVLCRWCHEDVHAGVLGSAIEDFVADRRRRQREVEAA